MNFLKFVFSFIYPVTIEKTSSKINPVLEVRIENGKYVLNALHANYSYGTLHQIFLKAFQRIGLNDRQIKNVLLLGFGAGSVPHLLAQEFKIDCKITAVEIDDKVIEIAKKYFNIQRFENLDLIIADAFEFVNHCNFKFDLIVVDIFINDKVPAEFESQQFLLALKKLMSDSSLLLFNKIVQSENGEEPFRRFLKNFKDIFPETETMEILGNRVIVAMGK